MVRYVYLFYNLAIFWLAFHFYDQILERKFQSIHPYRRMVFLQALICCFVFLFIDNKVIYALVSMLSFLFLVLFFYKNNLYSRLNGYFMIFFIMVFTETAICIILYFIIKMFSENRQISFTMIQHPSAGLAIVISGTALILDFFSFRKIGVCVKKYQHHLASPWMLKTGSAVLGLLVMLNLFGGVENKVLFRWYSVLFWLATLVITYFFRSSLKDFEAAHQEMGQMKLKKKQINRQLEYYDSMDREYQRIRKWNHDLSNHLLSLAYLIEQDKIPEARQYMGSLLEFYHEGEEK